MISVFVGIDNEFVILYNGHMKNISADYLDGFRDAQIAVAESFELLAQFETEQSDFFLELGQIIRNMKIIEDIHQSDTHPPKNFRDIANGE